MACLLEPSWLTLSMWLLPLYNMKCSLRRRLIAKFVVSRCAFCKLRRNFGFFCSINHLSGPNRKHMFTCDWWISIHFVCFCVSGFAACDRPVSGLDRLVFFEAFYDLSYSCLLQKWRNVCLLPSPKIPLIIAISFAILEQFRVILNFLFAGQAGRMRCIVIFFLL